MSIHEHVLGCYRAYKKAKDEFGAHPSALTIANMKQVHEALLDALEHYAEWDDEVRLP